jgi:hypothetical protein
MATQLQLFYAKLHQAETRLSNPEQSSVVLSYETLPFHASSPCLRDVVEAAESVVYHPLRIDVSDCVSYDETLLSLQILSCILMLNLAISSRSMIRCGAMGLNASPGMDMNSVLSYLKLVNILVEEFDETNFYALFLRILSLDTTVRALVEAGESIQAASAQARLSTLKLFVETDLSFLLTPHTAATAA